MQRLYSMFPLGGPGIGLASLRLAVAAGLFLDRFPMMRFIPERFAMPALVVVILSLAFGILTPVSAVLGLLIGCASLVDARVGQIWSSGLVVLTAVALLLLGPGAYSLDACIYGRHLLPRRRGKD